MLAGGRICFARLLKRWCVAIVIDSQAQFFFAPGSWLPGSTTWQTVFVKIVLLGDLGEPTTSFAPFEMAESVLNVFESGGTGNPSVLELERHLSAFTEMVSFSGHNLVLPERGFRAIHLYKLIER
jgi:hypothetical protein